MESGGRAVRENIGVVTKNSGVPVLEISFSASLLLSFLAPGILSKDGQVSLLFVVTGTGNWVIMMKR